MSEAEAKQWMKEHSSRLMDLRDELRVEILFAGAEARAVWRALEPRLWDVERLMRDVSETSRRAVGELEQRLQELRGSLRDTAPARRLSPPRALANW